MGATNRPDLVDSALLRPGRFDALLYVYVPKGTEPAMKVLKALTRKMTLEDGLVDKLPMLMEEHILKRHKGAALTGADMYGWASAAYLAALKRTVTELIDNGYVAGSLPDGLSTTSSRPRTQRLTSMQMVPALFTHMSTVQRRRHRQGPGECVATA